MEIKKWIPFLILLQAGLMFFALAQKDIKKVDEERIQMGDKR